MRRLKHSLFVLFLTISFISLSYLPSNATTIEEQSMLTTNSEYSIVPFKDHLIWKYKLINGKMYRRLYNNTTKQWIGNWILDE